MDRIAVVLTLLIGSAGCSNDREPAPPKVVSTMGADGIRRVAIEAGASGYVPDRIGGKPGEKVVLVFTRTVDGECLAQVKGPDGKLVELPKGKPVELAVTLPSAGAVTFACGMDMFKGTLVVTGS